RKSDPPDRSPPSPSSFSSPGRWCRRARPPICRRRRHVPSLEDICKPCLRVFALFSLPCFSRVLFPFGAFRPLLEVWQLAPLPLSKLSAVKAGRPGVAEDQSRHGGERNAWDH